MICQQEQSHTADTCSVFLFPCKLGIKIFISNCKDKSCTCLERIHILEFFVHLWKKLFILELYRNMIDSVTFGLRKCIYLFILDVWCWIEMIRFDSLLNIDWSHVFNCSSTSDPGWEHKLLEIMKGYRCTVVRLVEILNCVLRLDDITPMHFSRLKVWFSFNFSLQATAESINYCFLCRQ